MQFLFNRVQVRKSKLGIDDFDIISRRYPPIDMYDIIVIKTANNVNYCVNAADVPQKLVTQAFTLTGPFDQAGNINKLDSRRLDFLGIDNWVNNFIDCSNLSNSR